MQRALNPERQLVGPTCYEALAQVKSGTSAIKIQVVEIRDRVKLGPDIVDRMRPGIGDLEPEPGGEALLAGDLERIVVRIETRLNGLNSLIQRKRPPRIDRSVSNDRLVLVREALQL